MLVLILIIVLVVIGFIIMKNKSTEKTLYERLGGVYSIAAVVNHFSDSLIDNPIVGKNSRNPVLRDWHTNKLDRLPGLKFMRTLWVCAVTGGPYTYSPTVSGKCPFSLENAHQKFKISPEEFDAVAKELAKSLDHFSVPVKEKNEVLSAFASHKPEVNQGYFIDHKMPIQSPKCSFFNKKE